MADSSKLLCIPARPRRLGRHLLVDAWGVEPERLNDVGAVRAALEASVAAAELTLIETCVHQFSPYGVTATATLAESHMTIHTWPEFGYFAADLFACAGGSLAAVVATLREHFEPTEVRCRELSRGIDQPTEDESSLPAAETVP